MQLNYGLKLAPAFLEITPFQPQVRGIGLGWDFNMKNFLNQ
ncbi:unnamed protein product [Paramecium sonneborni]|uniref:Uncharacterized protein n=1 Tax=Paramecium sonneborni TaxID=65129 RepID=A0A8S1L8K7_9CILI|nr:unnamed protein product [Paramecium sonneborni]